MSNLLFTEVSVEQQEMVVGGVSPSTISSLYIPSYASNLISYFTSPKAPISVSGLLSQVGQLGI